MKRGAGGYVDPPLSIALSQVPPRQTMLVAANAGARSDTFSRLNADPKRQAIVGLKLPGTTRGVWQATRLISSKDVQAYSDLLRKMPGITVVYVDSLLPFIVVTVANKTAFDQLSKQPYIDYLEAADRQFKPADLGCDDNQANGKAEVLPSGDVLPITYRANGIFNAWGRFAFGQGVTVGIVDTGLSRLQPELQVSTLAQFGRSLVYQGCMSDACMEQLPNESYASCNHGPRVASVVGAPRNGSNVIGVAFESNLLVQKAGNSVWDEDEKSSMDHVLAIRIVRASGARVIEMAFGATLDSDAMGDEIRFEFYRTDLPEVLFVGAAGTGACPFYKPVAFPARMPEVLAVTGVNPDGTLESSSCNGDEVRIAAVLIDFESAGMFAGRIVTLGGTSGASAMVSGAAALVWSKYPEMTRAQVIERLTTRAARSQIGVPVLDVHKAVGGSLGGLITSSRDSAGPNDAYTVTASIDGDGPFSFQWATGETTQEIQHTGPGSFSVTVVDQLDGGRQHFSRTIPSTQDPACLASCQDDLKSCMDGAHSGLARQTCIKQSQACVAQCH